MNRLHRPSVTVRRCTYRLLLGLATAAALSSSHAATIDFETTANVVTPDLGPLDSVYAGRDQFTTAGFLATVNDSKYAQSLPDYQPGLAGTLMNSWNSCIINYCPYNETHFFAGLNGGGLTLQREDGAAFRLENFRYGFIGHDWEMENKVYGRLQLEITLADGSTVKMEQDMQEELVRLRTWDFSGQLGGKAITRLDISSCVFDGLGGCVNDDSTLNVAQFALDDINVSAVPEPAGYATLLAGLAMLGAWRRRRAAVTSVGGAA
jgi:MYXO-CTERM domain-containing protein